MDIPQTRLLSQRISEPAESILDAVRSLGAVQGQDYPASLWAVGVRATDSTSSMVEAAIADGTIVRTWPMRGTLHLIAAVDARWMLELLGPGMAAAHRRHFEQRGITEAMVSRSQELMVNALRDGRRLTRPELYDVLRDGGVPVGEFGLHLLSRAAIDRVVCYGPREGKQPTIVLFDDWIPASAPLSREEALAQVANRYFSGHGPATLHDFAWWSGLKMAEVKEATRSAEKLTSRKIDGRDYWFAAESSERAREPRATYVLPAFDEYLVGYRERSAVLSPSFSKRVNAGGGMLQPVLVRGGRVVGTWKRVARGKSSSIAVSTFAKPTAALKKDAESAFRRYLAFYSLTASVHFPE